MRSKAEGRSAPLGLVRVGIVADALRDVGRQPERADLVADRVVGRVLDAAADAGREGQGRHGRARADHVAHRVDRGARAPERQRRVAARAAGALRRRERARIGLQLGQGGRALAGVAQAVLGLRGALGRGEAAARLLRLLGAVGGGAGRAHAAVRGQRRRGVARRVGVAARAGRVRAAAERGAGRGAERAAGRGLRAGVEAAAQARAPERRRAPASWAAAGRVAAGRATMDRTMAAGSAAGAPASVAARPAACSRAVEPTGRRFVEDTWRPPFPAREMR